MESPSVFIVILNWNSSLDTIRCLKSLASIAYKNIHTLIIDNGSEDDSVNLISSAFPKVEMIQLDENKGFAGGCNTGIKEGLRRGFDSILLLNNDAVVTAQFLSMLVSRLFEERSLGAVQPTIMKMSAPEEVWNAGGKLSQIGFSKSIKTKPQHIEGERSYAVDWLTGCCLLLKSEVVEQVGLFDEKFFAYHEDVDLSIRIRNAEKRLEVVSGSLVYHDGGGSSTQKSKQRGHQVNPIVHYLNMRNTILIFRKHFGRYFLLHFLYTFFKLNLFVLYFAYRGNRAKQGAIWSGFKDGWFKVDL
jgi:GT2 family glycosyltransferase